MPKIGTTVDVVALERYFEARPMPVPLDVAEQNALVDHHEDMPVVSRILAFAGPRCVVYLCIDSSNRISHAHYRSFTGTALISRRDAFMD